MAPCLEFAYRRSIDLDGKKTFSREGAGRVGGSGDRIEKVLAAGKNSNPLCLRGQCSALHRLVGERWARGNEARLGRPRRRTTKYSRGLRLEARPPVLHLQVDLRLRAGAHLELRSRLSRPQR